VGLVARVLAAIVGLLDVETGSWALIDPRGWFASYPGFGHHWVAGEGSYNEHLVTDAGAGFLAIGIVLVFAAVSGRALALRLAAAGLLAHALPHFLFHVTNPHRGLHGFDVAAGVWGLLLESVVAIAILVTVRTERVR
jgi:hypothetical protein